MRRAGHLVESKDIGEKRWHADITEMCYSCFNLSVKECISSYTYELAKKKHFLP